MTHKRWWILLVALIALLQMVPGLSEVDDSIDARVEQILGSMTPEQKVYQMFMVTPEMLTGASTATMAGEMTEEALKAYPVGGLIYFAVNLKTPEQARLMISETQRMARENGALGLFMGVDEEGGTVARVASKLDTTKFGPMMGIGKQGDPKLAYDAYSTIAKDISQFGFNLDFAPVADVITNPKNTEIGSRAFGTTAELVSAMVPEAVKGLQDGGVLAAIKHFPGHGNTTANSHYKTTTTDRTLEQMRELEFLPFEAGIGAGAELVLISHLTATQVDDSAPASLNRTIVTDILRDELGFTGIVVTDALRMMAIAANYTPEQIALMTVDAGVDLLLMPANFKATSQALIEAVEEGRVPEARIDQSVRRILSAKLRYGIIQ